MAGEAEGGACQVCLGCLTGGGVLWPRLACRTARVRYLRAWHFWLELWGVGLMLEGGKGLWGSGRLGLCELNQAGEAACQACWQPLTIC